MEHYLFGGWGGVHLKNDADQNCQNEQNLCELS